MYCSPMYIYTKKKEEGEEGEEEEEGEEGKKKNEKKKKKKEEENKKKTKKKNILTLWGLNFTLISYMTEDSFPLPYKPQAVNFCTGEFCPRLLWEPQEIHNICSERNDFSFCAAR